MGHKYVSRYVLGPHRSSIQNLEGRRQELNCLEARTASELSWLGDEMLQVFEDGLESAHSWGFCLPVLSVPNMWGTFFSDYENCPSTVEGSRCPSNLKLLELGGWERVEVRHWNSTGKSRWPGMGWEHRV